MPRKITIQSGAKRHPKDAQAAGRSALDGVLARIEDAPTIQEQLTKQGGATSSHDVVDEGTLQTAAAQPSA